VIDTLGIPIVGWRHISFSIPVFHPNNVSSPGVASLFGLRAWSSNYPTMS
jgi:hypothetical protein